MLRQALLFSVVLVVYDALAALVARALAIAYDSFVVVALVLLFFMGIYAGRKQRSWFGMVPMASAACVEATLGWYVASLVGPGYVPGWTPRALIVMASEAMALSMLIGAIGVWVGLGVANARRERI